MAPCRRKPTSGICVSVHATPADLAGNFAHDPGLDPGSIYRLDVPIQPTPTLPEETWQWHPKAPRSVPSKSPAAGSPTSPRKFRSPAGPGRYVRPPTA